MANFQNRYRQRTFSITEILSFLLILIVSCFTTIQLRADDRVRPRALAISPEKTHLATANRIAGTVTILETEGLRKQAELAVGDEPLDLIWLSPDRLAVTVHRSRAIQLISRQHQKWQAGETVSLPGHPFSLAFSSKDNELLVTLHHPDQVLAVDLTTLEVKRSYSCGHYPRYLTLNSDEDWFAVTSELPAVVTCYERTSGKIISRQQIHQRGFNLGRPTLVDDNQLILPVTINRDFPATAGNIARGWLVNNRLVRLTVPEQTQVVPDQFSLDQRGDGTADLTGVFATPSGKQLAVLASGSQELILLQADKLHWPTTAHPGDFAPHYLSEEDDVLRRLDLSGRPMDLHFLDEETVVVANEMQDSIQRVDLKQMRVTAEVSLAPGKYESQMARGERIFYSGLQSKDGWMSCHTCHYDGHTSGQVFDTLNDATYDTKKLTLSLHDVANTEPWTWHGWQPDLTESMIKSLEETMHSPGKVPREDVMALVRFLETLEPISAVSQRSEESRKAGRELFYGKAGCIDCHQEPDYSSNLRYSVGRVESNSIYTVLNPPPLRGVSSRRRFLHHGRADSLTEVLRLYHRPEETSGAELTDREIERIVDFLSGL